MVDAFHEPYCPSLIKAGFDPSKLATTVRRFDGGGMTNPVRHHGVGVTTDGNVHEAFGQRLKQ